MISIEDEDKKQAEAAKQALKRAREIAIQEKADAKKQAQMERQELQKLRAEEKAKRSRDFQERKAANAASRQLLNENKKVHARKPRLARNRKGSDSVIEALEAYEDIGMENGVDEGGGPVDRLRRATRLPVRFRG
ncbi:hypothetical protein K402DRAFT_266798 [Aulographum hederae CBS 113979]|uniref:Uncharacterized protein n=1 Tax=Aulographum hederae CBS 113979 TaxID=1176131 RepID=A0A6G1GIN0_9PEZI|nr:hypothetical protein K402DRAFT_266798 [Aulographum hederae CBS 113979]